MSSESVTGKTQETIDEMRDEFHPDNDGVSAGSFEERYCLQPIPKQPPEYDGPQRYCVSVFTQETETGRHLCKYHGGRSPSEHLDKLAAMKHGMEATQDHLRQDFDDKDQALYEWVVNDFPAQYDIDIENDPAAAYDIHRLAVEIVRAERGRGYILREGEVTEKEVYGESGVVLDERGEIVTEKSEHYLAQMLHRQDKKISSIEKELGITRKERLKRDSTEDAVEAIKGFAEVGKAFLDRDSKGYDPDNQPWEDESD